MHEPGKHAIDIPPGTASLNLTETSSQVSPPPKPSSRRRRAGQNDDEDSSKRRCVSTACIACRRRKSKCDGNTPACAACSQVYGTECIYDPNSDHRRKGVYKNEADNLKTKDSTLRTLIQAILNSSEEDVPALIQQIRTCDSLDDVAEKIVAKENGLEEEDEEIEEEDMTEGAPTFESNLYGKMGDLRVEEGAVRYIGGTSNLIHVDQDQSMSSINGDPMQQHENAALSWTNVTSDRDLINHLLTMYFTWHYTYFTTVSKSLFYRDFQLGRPSSDNKRTLYCSPILVNAMLALGCHFTAHPGAREVVEDSATAGDHFFREAKRLLLEDNVLETPRLTTVQALALMSVREAGCAREARGWVYSGMAFRMSEDMGLHLDSDQLATNSSSSVDEAEVDARRITFWGCFLFDKCWSNYLGRLPQLPRSIVTTPKFEVFPDEDSAEWSPYTDSGYTLAHAQPSRVRAVALQIAKLCEISNDLMQNFYNPTDMDKVKGKQSELKKLSDIHTRLESWRRELPKEFEPREGGLSSVLVMHMFFQLLFIHLFRPFLKYTQSTSPLPSNVSPRKLCTHAATTISKLLRLYKRSHGLRQICNIAVYIAHSACTIHLLNLPDKNARRDIIHGVKHLEEIAEGWLCARRSLSILGLLAARWNVQLPHDAEIVLARSNAKFGGYKQEAASPSTDLKSAAGVVGLAAAAPQPPPPPPPAAVAHTNDPRGAGISELGLAPYAPNEPRSTTRLGLTTSQMLMQSIQQNGYFRNLPATTSQVMQRSGMSYGLVSPSDSTTSVSLQALPLQQSSISNRSGTIPMPRTTSATDASPSAMFGGVEQLLRESHDWTYKDQVQLGTGFGNWNSLDDDSTNFWTVPKQTRRNDGNNNNSSNNNNIISSSANNVVLASPATNFPMEAADVFVVSPRIANIGQQQQQQQQQQQTRNASDSKEWNNGIDMTSASDMYNPMIYNESEWYQ